MEGLELISFEIISTVGTAKSCFIEAIQEAKLKNFKRSAELLAEGDAYFTEGHRKHVQLIQKEAQGEETKPNLLLIHAEDQLMSAEAFRIIAEELIEIHQALQDLRNK